MTTRSTSIRVQLLSTLSVLGVLALYVPGLVLVARFALPIPSPDASAEQIAAMFAEHQTRIRFGVLMMVVGVFFFGPFGAVLVARTRRMEADVPVFTYLQLISFAATLAVTYLVPMAWALAAFRPRQDPNITQMFYDLGWFLLLYIWPLFTLWLWSLAAPILLAPKGTETFPRWVAYLSLWCGLLFAPSFLINFFKTGPFAYDGLFGAYVPAVALGLWGFGVMVALVQTIRKEKRTPNTL
ncbi:hypothetical protein NBRGN_110_02480 [Nocardia brasiliensis NBRC 14402]|uniref:hypothetical protein n=1 Tax=Nocardia brasiliensis TaxID=37326 RepID=UPI0002D64232|nr:hypothetical protein [Nocardia brasiliensis]ASF09477.1 hypothetical protein CEQ30_21270 [Nocardia brasiliensis]GAJ86583.1 hypothetical protein NBRGN_110_02480 [Nocardia brasiliensis NBRC 14402]SUB39812.1 Uncharacterised protein [Nocardia brasiliensis]